MKNNREQKTLELYIHIPFCASKCAYCDFLSFSQSGEVQKQYVDQLIGEMKAKSAFSREYQVATVFIGGGTPSILQPESIGLIMETVMRCWRLEAGAEITMEANPGTLDEKKLKHYRSAGINRLSLGLQSADNKELKLLGRIHSWEEFKESFSMARQAGFTNLNVDLMSALPGQTLESWKQTLQKTAALEPEHISAYSLIVEEGTPFYETYGPDAENLAGAAIPDEDTEREMYHETARILKAYGYHRYEISNYARKGRECRHNIGYWTGVPYLGLGLGASSYWEGERFCNTDKMERYLETDFGSGRDQAFTLSCRIEEIGPKEEMEEFMFLGLRLTEGISEVEFHRRFGCGVETIYGEALRKFEAMGMMENQGCRWRLTERGMDVSNYIMSEFLLEV